MPFNDTRHRTQAGLLSAAVLALLAITAVMLLSLMTRSAPHPPHEVPPFAIGPFLGASLAIGLAAHHLVRWDLRAGPGLALLFAATGVVSFGPQKYLDPAFSRIWPAVIAAQLAILVMLWFGAAMLRGGSAGQSADGSATPG